MKNRYLIGALYRYNVRDEHAKTYVVAYYFIEREVALVDRKVRLVSYRTFAAQQATENQTFIDIVFCVSLPLEIHSGKCLFSQKVINKNLSKVFISTKMIQRHLKHYTGAVDWGNWNGKNGSITITSRKMYLLGIGCNCKDNENAKVIKVKYFYLENEDEFFNFLDLRKIGKKWEIFYFTPIYETFRDGNELFYDESNYIPTDGYPFF